MEISMSRYMLHIKFGQTESFDPPKEAWFRGEMDLFSPVFWLKKESKWIVPNGDGSDRAEEMDDASREKLIPYIIKAAKEQGTIIELWV